jgi:hypothetical protein
MEKLTFKMGLEKNDWHFLNRIANSILYMKDCIGIIAFEVS